jgi:hypothetical protein
VPKISNFAETSFNLQKSLYVNELKNHFKDHSAFSNSELMSFYLDKAPDITKSTLNWRIHVLINQGIMKRLGRGLYALGTSIEYYPEINDILLNINKILIDQLPFAKTCLWNTAVFNQWMIHQPAYFYNIVEVEKDVLESAFHIIQEGFPDSFLQPDREILERYSKNKPGVILILPLVSEAPIQAMLHNDIEINTPSIEKVMVDVFCDEIVFNAQQGNELKNIYNSILSTYTVNTNKLLRYAMRRKKKEEFLEYIKTRTDFWHLFAKSAGL